MSTVGRYELVRRIGEGGMAEVWRARVRGAAGFEKVIALKRILPDLSDDSQFVQMFIEEAKLAAAMVHPNVVHVFDFGQSPNGEYYLAMEFVAGLSLQELLQKLRESGRRLSVPAAIYVAIEVCRGLAYAHGLRDPFGAPLMLVHRDVSPANILVSRGGEVKLTDFGIAKIAGSIARTQAGFVRGKLAYMSPEQASGQTVDSRSDLFSLGLVLYDLLTGRHLYDTVADEALPSVVMGFTEMDRIQLDAVPFPVRAILGGALVEVDKRFADATAMEAALALPFGSGELVEGRRELAALVQQFHREEEPAAAPIIDEKEAVTLPAVTLPPPEEVLTAKTAASPRTVKMTTPGKPAARANRSERTRESEISFEVPIEAKTGLSPTSEPPRSSSAPKMDPNLHPLLPTRKRSRKGTLFLVIVAAIIAFAAGMIASTRMDGRVQQLLRRW